MQRQVQQLAQPLNVLDGQIAGSAVTMAEEESAIRICDRVTQLQRRHCRRLQGFCFVCLLTAEAGLLSGADVIMSTSKHPFLLQDILFLSFLFL